MKVGHLYDLRFNNNKRRLPLRKLSNILDKNMLMIYGSLILAIVFETIATSFLKQSEQFTKLIPSLITITGYVLSFYFLSITVKTIPIGIVYAIWSGVGIFLVSMIGLFVFKQTLDAPACIGLVFIISGVLIINLFSKTFSH